MADDFCINVSVGVAYVMTQRENTIDCVSLNPASNSERFIIAGVKYSFRGHHEGFAPPRSRRRRRKVARGLA
jgi:hypothetical protein